MKKVQFLPNRWGRGVEQFKVPCQIFQDNVLTLNPCASKMLLFFYLRAQGKNQQLKHKGPQREPGIPLAISQKELTEKTGYSRNSLTAGAKELVAKGWLEPLPEKRARPKRGELCVHEYFLLDHETGERLPPVTGRPLLSVYFTVPAQLVRKHEMHWSLAALSRSETTAYVTLLFRANEQRSNTFRARDPQSGIPDHRNVRRTLGSLGNVPGTRRGAPRFPLGQAFCWANHTRSTPRKYHPCRSGNWSLLTSFRLGRHLLSPPNQPDQPWRKSWKASPS